MLGIAGAIGGAVRTILGYFTNSDEGESFDYAKMAKTVITAAIAGWAVGAALPETTDFLTAFLTAAGVGIGTAVTVKESAKAVKISKNSS